MITCTWWDDAVKVANYAAKVSGRRYTVRSYLARHRRLWIVSEVGA